MEVVQGFELVNDDFNKPHEQLDEELCGILILESSPNATRLASAALVSIVLQSKGRMKDNYLNIKECEKVIEREPKLLSMISTGSREGYRSIRLLSKRFD